MEKLLLKLRAKDGQPPTCDEKQRGGDAEKADRRSKGKKRMSRATGSIKSGLGGRAKAFGIEGECEKLRALPTPKFFPSSLGDKLAAFRLNRNRVGQSTLTSRQ